MLVAYSASVDFCFFLTYGCALFLFTIGTRAADVSAVLSQLAEETGLHAPDHGAQPPAHHYTAALSRKDRAAMTAAQREVCIWGLLDQQPGHYDETNSIGWNLNRDWQYAIANLMGLDKPVGRYIGDRAG